MRVTLALNGLIPDFSDPKLPVGAEDGAAFRKLINVMTCFFQLHIPNLESFASKLLYQSSIE